ncbi:ArnT family glycosyltransferase [Natrarchaeobius chitinivorans]|uniref:Glycosyltransferase RgtA/B/C/D-like domain-containing protein n=1 Tax=Natrarchaeobius chitinivorans TaxID=1679083 RepID=A0A3N6LUN3_NATCH|nr:hypothetical protein [Natrarchaeobius chitinivorans]RQG94018.1 hypothetical protein EA473_13145 [Natrarchaeobius chitinivorans]
MDWSAYRLPTVVDREFDRLISIVAFGGGIVISVLSVVLGLGQYGLGLALIVGPIAYVGLRGRSVDRTGRVIPCPSIVFEASSVVFLVALAVSSGSLLLMDHARPAIHFVAVTVAFGTVALDVVYHAQADRRSKQLITVVVFLKLIATSLVYRTGRFFVTPHLPGYDVNSHLGIATEIVTRGGLPPESSHLYGRYVWASIFHTLVATLRQLGLEESSALFVVVCFFAVATILLTYAIVTRLASEQAALFAALFVSVADMFVLRGVTSITPSILVIVFTMAVLVLFVRLDGLARVGVAAIVSLLAVALFTHQLSSLMLSFVLVSLIAGTYAGRALDFVTDGHRPTPLSPFTVALVGLLTVASWMVTEDSGGTDLLTVAVLRVVRMVTRVTSGTASASYAATFGEHSVLSNLLYNLGYSILFALGVVGALLWTHHRNRTTNRLAFLIAAAGLFVLLYPGTVAGLSMFIIPHRVLVFLVLFVVVFAGVACAQLISLSRQHQFSVVPVVVLLVFFSVTAPFIAQDNPLYAEERTVQTELTDDEIDAMLYATAVAYGSETLVYVDPLLDPRGIVQEQREAGQDVHRLIGIYPPDDDWVDGSLVVVRDDYTETGYQNANPGTFGSAGQQFSYGPEPLAGCDRTIVYQNDGAAVYSLEDGC